MVGRYISYENSPFWGDMLVFGGVRYGWETIVTVCHIERTMPPPLPLRGAEWSLCHLLGFRASRILEMNKNKDDRPSPGSHFRSIHAASKHSDWTTSIKDDLRWGVHMLYVYLYACICQKDTCDALDCFHSILPSAIESNCSMQNFPRLPWMRTTVAQSQKLKPEKP